MHTHSPAASSSTDSTLAELHDAPDRVIHGRTEALDGIKDVPSFSIGTDAPGEVSAALEARVQQAVENGLSPDGKKVLGPLLHEYEDVFALKLGPQPSC
jgi:hypothetical protein